MGRFTVNFLLLLLSRFSRVRLCATPETAAPRLTHPWDSPGKNTGVGCHFLLQYMKVKSKSEVTQSCLTPSDPMDCSLPGSSVHGIFQARVLEWVAIAFSILLSKCCIDSFSCWTMSEPVVSQLHLLPFLKNSAYLEHLNSLCSPSSLILGPLHPLI